MKVIQRTIYLFVIACGINFAFGDELKVMTYNMCGMGPGTEPEVRIVHIIDKLIEIDPDIIGLQEINESLNSGGAYNQAKVIADSLSAYFKIPYFYHTEFTYLTWDNQFREFIGIITKHPVEEKEFYQLATGVYPRKVLWNKIMTPLGTVNFFNTHLSPNPSSVRIQQVQQIISYIKNIELNNPTIATILTGDFNDTPNSTSIQQLTNTGTDTFYVSSYAFVNPDSSGNTKPSNNPTRKIDYVFMNNTGNIVPFKSTVVMNQPYSAGNFCSDHLGVLTSFRKNNMDVDDESSIYPAEYRLFQCYPNPFNSITKIKYSIPSAGANCNSNVQLKVYDILGIEIITLVNKEKPAGIYEVEFIGNGLSSGIYFYRMQADTYTATKKLILMK
jgi:endonuclease/exonuclease/phosphatase family metal-dependent hydrolase